jgi:hypothetical protein
MFIFEMLKKKGEQEILRGDSSYLGYVRQWKGEDMKAIADKLERMLRKKEQQWVNQLCRKPAFKRYFDELETNQQPSIDHYYEKQRISESTT